MYHYSLLSFHDTLMQKAKKAYEQIHMHCSSGMILPWIVEYLTLYVYVSNLLPEAAFIMDKNSGNRGEGAALAQIKKLEKIGY